MAEPAAAVPAPAASAAESRDWRGVVEGLRGSGGVDLKRLQNVIARAAGHYATTGEVHADIAQEAMCKVISAARRDLIREPEALPRFARAVARNGAVNWLAGAAARRRRELEAGLAGLAQIESSAAER